MFTAVFNHTLEIGTKIVSAGHSAIDICTDDKHIVLFCKFLTHAKLSFDRLFRLAVARIPSIDNCCFHNRILLRKILSFDGKRTIRVRQNRQGKRNEKKYCVNGKFWFKFSAMFFPLTVLILKSLSRLIHSFSLVFSSKRRGM